MPTREDLISVLLAATAGLSAMLIAPAPAFAYLDAGTGSAVFQWVIAGAVGAAFALRLVVRQITSMLRYRKNSGDGSVD